MAENQDIAFDLSVNTGSGAKSLADLKKEFKEAQVELSKTVEGTKEYQKALEKLGAIKDDIGDLRDTISALNPEGKVAAFTNVAGKLASGFQAAQGAAALFGSESEALEKTLLKVQAATALAQGIKEVSGLTDAFKVLGTVIKSNPLFLIAGVMLGVAAAGAKLFEAFQAQKSAVEGLTIALEAQKKVFSEIIRQDQERIEKMEAELGLAKAQGKSTKELQILEEQLFNLKKKTLEIKILELESAQRLEQVRLKEIQDIDTLSESFVKFNANLLKKIGLESLGETLDEQVAENKTERSQEVLDKIEKNERDLDDLRTNLAVLDINRETKVLNDKNEAHKKYIEDKKKREKEANDEFARMLDLTVQSKIENEARDKKAIEDQKQAELDAMLAIHTEAEAQYQSEKVQKTQAEKEDEERRARRIEGYKETEAQQLALTKQTLQATQALTDLYFSHQMKMAKGNADRERELKKKQFNVNKAFGIAGSIIDGVQAIQKALNNPYPLNIILAVLTGVLATANTVKIASTKFDDGGGSSGSAGDIGGGMTASAPAIPQPNNTVTKISDDGKVESANTKPKDQRVYVVETDIKKSNDRVANIEETAKIG